MKIKDNLSPLGLHALELDAHFLELQRLSEQIEQTSLDSDSDFQLAVKLLTKFTDKAMGIEEVVKQFSKCLEEARENSNHAVKIVSEKAQLIQQRKQQKENIQEQLNELGNRVREVISALATFNKAQTETPDGEQKISLTEKLRSIESQLGEFIEEAQTIKDQAHQIKFKDASRSAESLHATLQNAKNKLSNAIGTIH